MVRSQPLSCGWDPAEVWKGSAKPVCGKAGWVGWYCLLNFPSTDNVSSILFYAIRKQPESREVWDKKLKNSVIKKKKCNCWRNLPTFVLIFAGEI